MEVSQTALRVQWLRRYSRFAAGLSIVIGLLALLGWYFDVELLRSFVHGIAAMSPNSALGILMAGTGLLTLGRQWINETSRTVMGSSAGSVPLALGFCCLAFGVLTLLGYLPGRKEDLDFLLSGIVRNTISNPRLQVAFPTALGLVFVGVALVCLAVKRCPLVFQSSCCVAAFIGLASFTAYLYGSHAIFAASLATNISINTSIALLLLSTGMIAAWPEHGLARVSVGESGGGLLVRQVLPWVVLIPLIAGWLLLQVKLDTELDEQLKMAMMAVSCATLLLILIWRTSLILAEGEKQRARVLANLQKEVAERQRAEKKLVSQTKLLDLSQDAIFTWQLNAGIRYWNRGGERLCGYTPEEAFARLPSELLKATPSVPFQEINAALERDGLWKGEIQYMTRDNRRITVESTQQLFSEPDGSKTVLSINHDITERKRAENALRASEQRKAAIMESALDCIVTMDENGLISEFNPAAERTFGYQRDEVIGKPLADMLVPPSLRERHIEGLKRYLATGENAVLGKRIEMPAQHATGREFPVELAIVASQFDGRPFFTGYLRDITTRKKAEQALQQSEERFRLLVESSPNALLMVNSAGRITLVNQQAEQLFGYARHDLLEKAMEALVPGYSGYQPALPDEFAAHSSERPMGDGRDGRDLWALRQDGSKIPVEIGLVPIETRDGSFTLATITDIAARRQAYAIQAILAAIVESSDDAIIGLTMDGTVTAWNRGAERIFGYRAGEMLGNNISRLHPPDRIGEEAILFNQIRKGKRLEHHESVRVTKDGRMIDVSLTISPLYNSSHVLTGVSKIARDITDRKRAEQEILELNADLERRVQERTAALQLANSELEGFTYSVSHDLRAPLRHMQGFAQMLEKKCGSALDETGKRYLGVVLESATRMGMLMDQLLTFSRLGRAAVNKRSVELRELVQTLIQELGSETEGRNIRWIQGELPVVQADPELLRLVISNLLSNAIKFTRHREEAVIEVGAKEEDENWTIFVRDNGAGFDPQYAAKLFGVFQRLHRSEEFEGTGIGLANARRIISRHGGQTWAEGVLDQGATFYFTLPKQPTPITENGIEAHPHS